MAKEGMEFYFGYILQHLRDALDEINCQAYDYAYDKNDIVVDIAEVCDARTVRRRRMQRNADSLQGAISVALTLSMKFIGIR